MKTHTIRFAQNNGPMSNVVAPTQWSNHYYIITGDTKHDLGKATWIKLSESKKTLVATIDGKDRTFKCYAIFEAPTGYYEPVVIYESAEYIERITHQRAKEDKANAAVVAFGWLKVATHAMMKRNARAQLAQMAS